MCLEGGKGVDVSSRSLRSVSLDCVSIYTSPLVWILLQRKGSGVLPYYLSLRGDSGLVVFSGGLLSGLFWRVVSSGLATAGLCGLEIGPNGVV